MASGLMSRGQSIEHVPVDQVDWLLADSMHATPEYNSKALVITSGVKGVAHIRELFGASKTPGGSESRVAYR